MDLLRLKKTILKYYKVSEDSFEKLLSKMNFQRINKTVFLKEGELANTEYFLLSGIVREYVFSENGKEITTSFYTENEVVSPMKNRSKGGRSLVFLEALTDSRIASIKNEDFFSLLLENDEIRQLGCSIVEKDLLQKNQKNLELTSYKAKERLMFFRNKYPTLEDNVSHAYIASYLGITTVSLSRLRNDCESVVSKK